VTQLSDLQLSVLCWVAGGATGKEIAAALGTSLTAVNNSLFEARLKLGARNTTHAVAIAYQRGILTIEQNEAGETP